MIFKGLVEHGILFDIGNHKAKYIIKYFNKTARKNNKSYECLDVSDACRNLPIFNNFNFFGIHANAFDRNNQSQITDFDDEKFTFIDVCL